METAELYMKEKKVTFADLAELTGFSKTTISRYFNSPDTLTETSKARIDEAIRKLGYKENKLAKVLANGRTEIVGIIVPNLHMHYYADLLSCVLNTAEKHGYKFLVFNGENDKERDRSAIRELLAYKAEGIIIISHTCTSEELSKLGIPVVTIEREDRYVNSVNSDNYEGGITAVSHLVSCGCEMLIHINADLNKVSPAYGRILGFRNVAAKSGLPAKEYLTYLGNEYLEIKPKMESILADIEKNYPGVKKGIFVSNDTAAYVLVNLLLKRYKYLPDDYLIVGFDDSLISRESVIPITTIHQDIRTMADTAMDLLVRQMKDRAKNIDWASAPLEHRIIKTELLVRETTKREP